MKFVPRSGATRQAIIEATADLFNKKGYAGTSITDLEKVTRLTKGSIYGNFENKEQVGLAVFDYNLEKLRKGLRLAADSRQQTADSYTTYTRSPVYLDKVLSVAKETILSICL